MSPADPFRPTCLRRGDNTKPNARIPPYSSSLEFQLAVPFCSQLQHHKENWISVITPTGLLCLRFALTGSRAAHSICCASKPLKFAGFPPSACLCGQAGRRRKPQNVVNTLPCWQDRLSHVSLRCLVRKLNPFLEGYNCDTFSNQVILLYVLISFPVIKS